MNYVELRAGVEPAIYSLQVNCLTIRLSKHKVELFRTSTNPIFYKWGYDLIYYCNYILAEAEGFEPSKKSQDQNLVPYRLATPH